MQQNTVYLNLSTAQHVSGCISTHHQELISLYLQYLALLGAHRIFHVSGLRVNSAFKGLRNRQTSDIGDI